MDYLHGLIHLHIGKISIEEPEILLETTKIWGMPILLVPISTFIAWPIAKQQEKDWVAETQQHL